MLLIATHRTEYRENLSAKGDYTRIQIDPLDVDTAGELLRCLLGTDPSLDSRLNAVLRGVQKWAQQGNAP